MGDRRYDASYDALAQARDRPARLRAMGDEALVQALAAASRKMDAYLANVLAVELLRRRRRQRAAFWGVVVGLGSALVVRTLLIVLSTPDVELLVASTLALVPCAALGWATYRLLLARASPAPIDPRR